MKVKLNRNGLFKILPLLEEIADELYSECGGLWIRIGYDGELRVETKDPSPLFEEAAKSDITVAYVGKDKFGECCFDVYVPIMEIGGSAGPGPGQSITTPAGAPISHSPASVSAQKGVGATAQAEPSSSAPPDPATQMVVDRAVEAAKEKIKDLIDKMYGPAINKLIKAKMQDVLQ